MSALVSDGDISGPCRRCRWPCTRTCGGVFVAMCRSEPFRSTVIFSRSGSVAILVARVSRPRGRNGPSPGPGLLDGLPYDFLDRRHSALDLAQTAHAERNHPFVDRLAPQLESRGADENELAQLLGYFHHLVQANAAFVPGVVAALAAFAAHRRDGVGILGSEAGL